ncbi:MAG: V-type ATP synthase subunit E [Ruminococcus sp.]|nr:V-type ATP synthase subunit E [Ruminococcus sp.]
MNGGEKILDRIKSDCDDNIREIEAKSAETCSQIISEGKTQAEKISADIAKKADAKVIQINAMSKSRAELETRNALLKRRRKEIDITLGKLLDYLVNLGDKEYFDIIYRLASRLNGKKGEIFLNANDISRLPSDFEQKLKLNGLDAVVSKAPADISGGFILKCGDIEENMDFEALISAKQDGIEDLINRELFSE